MKSTLKPGVLSHSVGLAFAVTASLSYGQTPPNQPDAGSLMGSMPHAPAAAPSKSPSFEVMQEVRPPLVAPGGIKVKVNSFKVTGNSVFSEARLQALIGGYVGKELDLAGLDEAASVISQFYRDQGYFVARAYLPAQPIAGGHLEIAVIEGRLGAVKMARNGNVRLREDVAQGIVTQSANLGAPINDRKVERGLMLLNDLPGVEVKSTLVPGASLGTSDLVVETTQGPLVNGSVDIDNFGNKFSGPIRVGASVNINDPSGRGDQIVLRAMASDLLGKAADAGGMRYYRAAYSLPVSRLGTKLGLAYTSMNYTLGQDFKDLNATGNSAIGSLFAVHPLLRSRNANLYGTVSYDDKRIQDNQLGVNRADKAVKVLSLGLSGDMRDGHGGGGMNSGSLSLTSGRLSLNNYENLSSDIGFTTPGPQTNGAYNKFNYNLSRLQRVDDLWSLYGSVSGQYASKNLDSSEKFVLGGMGVRAYPQGEAAGDEGLLLNLEARFSVPGMNGLQLIGFVDVGSVTLHKTTWPDFYSRNLPNSYTLAGYGFGVNFYKEADYSIRASIAWKSGSNPGASTLGYDADNANTSPRFWLQATKQF